MASLSASELAKLLAAGDSTSVEVTERLIGRAESIDSFGPNLRSVIEIAPDALEAAARLDAERRAGQTRGPLHGVPVLLKDNVDTVAPLHTTAGSLVFGETSPPADASVVSALRAAGALVLGKTNLSEWANFRGRPSSSGWSAVGGQTRNPHALDRSPGGSSAGSGSAVAARLAPLAIGTETNGSIICPAAACGVLGLKPTVGLVSRTGIIPIAASQDTAGPMGRSTEDLALLLEVLARAVDDGEDSQAVSSRRPASHETHYLALLGDGGLAGLRIGVLRGPGFTDYHPPTDRVFEQMLLALGESGAEIVDSLPAPAEPLRSFQDDLVVLTHEFDVGLGAYLARRGQGDPTGVGLPTSVADVVAFTEREPRERADVFGLDLLARSAASGGLEDPDYKAALERNHQRVTGGLDGLFGPGGVDVVALPAMQPAWLIDHVLGDSFVGAGWGPPAVAGYPSATLPIGRVGGMPVGVALWGRPWSEATLLRVMFALERLLGPAVTNPVPSFAESVSLRA